mmetsp:Transcript_53225/g.116841  ORF Transcript_53225/g.116841 Transcript_53225/m.116841 type:complete len:191 (+) Transcript_53225:24-596(+)|eukprot:CAMPEP_0204277782 /NCGR_PEP_ID=MMETSP0468-20130131/29503_1 /ASSEMBLY_ACC=CAM_ASM_000383 /TAXON_ID=2969 /ORGANISM="Oxyrrhis marina" /LENGTH=190 /DNA_ID=CAMNT_0051254617 /DNA_START=21 /DNA_END=593 /DNA_ORIENTATION=+
MAAEEGFQTPSELLAAAQEFKKQGNAFFKEGNYPKALFQYHQALNFVKPVGIPGEVDAATSQAQALGVKGKDMSIPAEELDELRDLKASTNLNMLQCYMKQDPSKLPKALASATEALRHRETSKGYFKRGQCHLLREDIDGARHDFEKARELDTDAVMQKAIESELAKLTQIERKQQQQQKKAFGNMFKA